MGAPRVARRVVRLNNLEPEPGQFIVAGRKPSESVCRSCAEKIDFSHSKWLDCQENSVFWRATVLCPSNRHTTDVVFREYREDTRYVKPSARSSHEQAVLLDHTPAFLRFPPVLPLTLDFGSRPRGSRGKVSPRGTFHSEHRSASFVGRTNVDEPPDGSINRCAKSFALQTESFVSSDGIT